MQKSCLLHGLTAACVLTIALLIAFPNPAYSQLAGSATITGTVTDPSGAVVPAADAQCCEQQWRPPTASDIP
jgi:hypothetical protein